MYNCSSSTDTDYYGATDAGTSIHPGCSNCTNYNCQDNHYISVSNCYSETDNENFDFLKQIALYERWLEQRRTLRNWWMDGFITNHRVYNVPRASRVRFYKILACNRKGISLRIKGRR
jgi:hypothetical protein